MSLTGYGGALAFPGLALLGMGLLFWFRGRDERGQRAATGFASAAGQGGFIPSSVQDACTPSYPQDTPSAFGTGGPAPMQVEAPPGARPGLMGVLVDECAQVSAIAATVVDLAVRGYLHVDHFTRETGVPRALLHGLSPGMEAMFGPQDANKAGPTRGFVANLVGGYGWMLTMTEPPPDAEPLLAYEQALLQGIFANQIRPPDGTRPGWHFTGMNDLGTPTPSNTYPVALATLRTTFTPTARSVRSYLYSEVVSRGWFRSSPRTVRLVWYGIAWALLLGGVGTLLSWSMPSVAAVTDALSNFGTSAAAPAVGMVVAGLVVAAFGRVMPSRTATGAALHAQAKGFRQYLLAVQPAQVGPQQRFGMFCAFLPYAMVLGVEKHWTEAFSQLGNASEGAVGTQYADPGRSGASRSSEDYSQLSKFAKEVGRFVKSARSSTSTNST